MEIIQKDQFRVLIPTVKEFMCSIEDKERYDAEVEAQKDIPEEYRWDITPIYKFKEAYVPEGKTVDDYVFVFMEID